MALTDDGRQWISSQLARVTRRMEDALTVDAAMLVRREARIKEHEEWLRENELAMARHREMLLKHNEFLLQHEVMMIALDAKLDRIAELILKGHSGNGGGC